MTPARLHPDDLDLLAELVADRLGERLGTVRAAPVAGLLTATQVAERFGVSPEWIRDHADELGVIRLGNGARPRLRFEPAKVAAALTPDEGIKGSDPPKGQRRRAKSSTRGAVAASGCPLLPIAGGEA